MSSEYIASINRDEILIGRRQAGINEVVFAFNPSFILSQDGQEIKLIPADEMVKLYDKVLSPEDEIKIEGIGKITWHELKKQFETGELVLSNNFTGSIKIY